MKRIGLVSAIALGVSSIIGSGWLFAPYKAAAVAGPAAIFAWLLGGLLVCLLGLCFAEIAAIYPKRGLSAIIPLLSHNKYFSFPFAIANWLGIVAVIGLEADATIQYLIMLVPTWKAIFFQADQLTSYGVSLSVLLVIGYTLVNYWGASALIKTNNVFTVIKVFIPIVVAFAVVTAAFHPHNFTVIHHSFVPYGFSSILSAILTTGIIIAFNGFQTVISFSSEVKKPHRTIPLSVVTAILLCMVIYVLLQAAFIGGVPESMAAKGWDTLSFTAPMVQILGLVGLGLLSTVFLSGMVYFGATISPSGTALAYTGSSARMVTAMSQHEQMPRFFDAIHPVYNVSRRSLIFNTLLVLLFLILFRSWSSLALVLSLFHVISYIPIPIALWVLRSKIERNKYPFRVPFGRVISLVLFVFFTYLFTLADMKTVVQLMTIFAGFMVIFTLINTRSLQQSWEIVKHTWSIIVYFIVLFILTAISPKHLHWLSDGQFITLLIAASLLLFFCLVKTQRDDVVIVHPEESNDKTPHVDHQSEPNLSEKLRSVAMDEHEPVFEP